VHSAIFVDRSEQVPRLIPPEIFEPIGRQLRIPHCVLNILVPHPGPGSPVGGAHGSLTKEERLFVARRIFEALCAHYPGRYIALVDRAESAEPSPSATADLAGDSFPERLAKAADSSELFRVCGVNPGLSDDAPRRFVRLDNPFLFFRVLQGGFELLAV
jgi:hypothetical protein